MHLLHVFPSFQLGGSQRRFIALANHFGARYRHTIISLDGDIGAATLLRQAVPHLVLRPPKTRLGSALLLAHHTIRRLAPDLLVTYNWGAMEWAAVNLICPPRHVHIEDGFGPEEIHAQLRRRVLFRRLILNLRSTLVLPSRNLVDIAAKLWRISPKRIVYLPNGIPCSLFQRSAVRGSTTRFHGDGPIIGTVATLRKEKAIDRLIHAFQNLRASQAARLVIVGDGPERSALETLVASCGLQNCVTFTGSLSHPENVLADFDLFASSSETEQMPLSILEAMAAGLPIVSTDVGDIRLMVSESNHPFIVAKNAPALANAMRRLLQDGVLSRQVGASNRKRAETEFDESKMFSRYQTVFSGQA